MLYSHTISICRLRTSRWRTCKKVTACKTRIFREYIPHGKCVCCVEQFNYGVLMMIGVSVSEPLHW